jgi:hypothetical protein
MKNIKQLQITEGLRGSIIQRDTKARRFAKIRTDILDVTENIVTVRVEQFQAMTDKVFSSQELIEKGKEILNGLEEYYKIRWRPLEFKGEGLDAVDHKWVRNQMKKHDLRQVDICEALGVDKHVMSKLMSGQYGFTNWHKAAFYYYFKNR